MTIGRQMGASCLELTAGEKDRKCTRKLQHRVKKRHRGPKEATCPRCRFSRKGLVPCLSARDLQAVEKSSGEAEGARSRETSAGEAPVVGER